MRILDYPITLARTWQALAWMRLGMRMRSAPAIRQSALTLGQLVSGRPQAPLRRRAVRAVMLAGHEFLAGYEVQRAPSLLDSAVDVLRLGAGLVADNSTEWLATLNALGMALAWRWQRAGNSADLDEAIDAFEQAAKLTPAGPDRCGSLANLGNVLLDRVETVLEGQAAQADTSRAITALRSSLAECPDAEAVPYRLLQLAGAYLAGAASALRPDGAVLTALDQAEEAALSGLDAAATDSAASWRSQLLRRLGEIRHARWGNTGDPVALGYAIEAYRDAVLAAGEEPAIRAEYLSALGAALMEVYRLTGALSYLEAAGAALAVAVDDTPEDDQDFAAHLSNVAVALGFVAEAVGDPGRMEEALRLHRRALERDKPPTPVHGLLLGRYGTALVDAVALAARDTESADPGASARLDEAVAALRASIELGGPDLDPAEIGNNLGNALLLRAERATGTADLTEAVRRFEYALAANDDPLQEPIYLTGLGAGWRLLYGRTGDEAARQAGVTAYQQACAASRAPGRAALAAAANWGAWETRLENWRAAAQAYERCLDITESLVGGQTMRTHQQAWLGDVHELPAQAGYAWLRCGELSRAADAVERGRVVLLRHQIGATPEPPGTGADSPAGEPPDAQAALLAAREAGDALRLATLTPEPAGVIADRIRQAQRLVSSPPPLHQDAGATGTEETGEGVVVYLCPCDPEGFLLAVAADGQVLAGRRLPRLTRKALRDQAFKYFDAYDQRRRDLGSWERALDAVTAWLWDACAGQLLACVPAEDQVTIVAGGLLGLLPVHAAWTRDEVYPSGRRYLIDETAVSYAPSRSLLRPAGAGAGAGPSTLLAISDPRPSRQRPLPWASWEVSKASGYFDRAVGRTGPAATVDTCLRDLGALGPGDVFHAACHGQAAPDTPFRAGLLMADDQELSLDVFFGRPPVAARLAVLSACETSLPGVDLPEEALAFPTAFLQIGFTGVIAGQWSIPETAATAALVAEFYRRWRRTSREPRQALREAQRWLRDATNGEKADAFPGLFPAPPLSEPALSFWRQARAHHSPRHWASLVHWGN